MNIAFVEIQNFRKLKSCRVEIAAQETILVGANNSGKTSAMDSLILFLKKSCRKDIAVTDFTLSNWLYIDQIAMQWVNPVDDDKPNLTFNQWLPFLPSIDIWLDANDADIHHVIHLLPTLDWAPEQKLGVRLVFAPKDIEKLYKEFRDTYQSARDAEPSDSSKVRRRLSLWPKSTRDFLDRDLHKHFEVKAYILDPSMCCDPENGIAKPQPIPADSGPMDREPFDGLFKIDVISAQQGFSDPKTEDESHSGFTSLSTQLRQYFTKHLNPSESPDVSDIDALQAIEEARAVFDEKLKTSFKPAIGELEGLNYSGFSDLSKRPKSSGKLLLWDGIEERYRYSVFVTNLDLPSHLVWKLYRDRADAENRIKELKYDFGADSFCLSSFFATEAAFRFIMVAYNLLSLFRQIVLRERKQSTLKTLRFKCFALGAWITKHSRQKILKIALAREKRAWLDGLFDIAGSTAPPFKGF